MNTLDHSEQSETPPCAFCGDEVHHDIPHIRFSQSRGRPLYCSLSCAALAREAAKGRPEHLTQERLKQLLHYEPETGVFRRLVGAGRAAPAGQTVGTPMGKGYLVVSIDGKKYLLQRLAWLYMTGKWPSELIDHEDHIKTNNRWKNLRAATRTFNAENMVAARVDNQSGLLGVKVGRKGRPAARITVNGERIHLGTFESPAQAHEAYVDEKRRSHEGNTL